MKVRSGFVSNSSSSSFILKFNDRFPDTASIAENMIKDKFDDWVDFGDIEEGDPFMSKVYNNLEKFKSKHYNPRTPIFFKSCNYDTYIVPITENYVLIDTCNNTDWSIQYDSDVVHGLPDEVLEKYPESEGFGGHELYIVRTGELDQDGYGVSIKYNAEYYLVEEGVFMVSPDGYQYCKKSGCYEDIWFFNGVKYCMKCDRDKLMRSMKIKKIKNAII